MRRASELQEKRSTRRERKNKGITELAKEKEA